MPVEILIAIISYMLGIMSGIFISTMFKDRKYQANYKNVVLIVVSVMWTISVAYEIINPTYHTSPLIHGLMGSIVGFFYKFEPKKPS